MRNGSSTKGGARVPRRSGEAGLVAVPRLEELAADPSKAGVLDTHTTRKLAASGLKQTAIGLAATLALICRLLDPADGEEGEHIRTGADSNATANGDLTNIASIDEVAKTLGIDGEWIKRNARTLPFVKRLSRKNSICLKPELMRWLASRPSSGRGG
jgi:hypothetical protein